MPAVYGKRILQKSVRNIPLNIYKMLNDGEIINVSKI